jgi:2-oxoglutarate ferredoxin oxidoreductase subunit gamma
MSQYEVTFAGFGGQGVMVAGQLLAYAAIAEEKNAVWIPSYGPEMRGGTAYCMVVVSDKRIGSPIINHPQAVCVFNMPSFEKFTPRVKAGGLALVNSSLISAKTDRTDITEVLIPASQMAIDAGNPKAANIVVLGAFVGITGLVSYDTLRNTVQEKLGKKKEFLEANLRLLEQGHQIAQQTAKQRSGV